MFFNVLKKKSSGNICADRLRLVLAADRAGCSFEIIEVMKDDIINVISRYADVDKSDFDIRITQTFLITKIPINKMKTLNR